MVDRDKVIEDVKQAIKILGNVDEPTFWLDFVRVAVERALELLKEHEPRVLTLEELCGMPCDTPICVEEYYGSCSILYMDIYNGIDADSTDFITGNVQMECSYWIREEYGNLYRFWTAKPTDEQRKAVKWGE